jgi:hypothetical protein
MKTKQDNKTTIARDKQTGNIHSSSPEDIFFIFTVDNNL